MRARPRVERMVDGFLGRWSQRKQALREGRILAEPAAPPASLQQQTPAASPAQLPPANGPASTLAPGSEVDGQTKPALTLEDVQALTPDASFAPFVARDVAPEVRNAAMKKLFANPHYNVMDGLDIYIDDYAKPSPLSAAQVRQMVSAQFLRLADEPEAPPANAPGEAAFALSTQPAASDEPVTHLPDCPTPAADETVSPEPDTDPAHHDHTDLRLQPNHAASGHEPGRRPQ